MWDSAKYILFITVKCPHSTPSGLFPINAARKAVLVVDG